MRSTKINWTKLGRGLGLAPHLETLEDRSVPAVTATFAGTLLLNSGTDSRASSLSNNETEVSIAANPTAPSNVMLTSNNESVAGQLFERSANAGIGWVETQYAADGNANGFRFDGATAIDDFGNIHVVYQWAIPGTASGIYHAVSTDGGATFTPTQIAFGPNLDKPWVAVGPDAQNPANQAVVVTYRNVAAGNSNVYIRGASISGLGAVGSFSPAVQINDAAITNQAIPAIGPNGEVAVAFQQFTLVGQNAEISIMVDHDADGLVGGLTFGTDVAAADTNIIAFDKIPAQQDRGIHAMPHIVYDRSGGPFDGRLYLVYPTRPPGDDNNDLVIRVRHSDDNGATFSVPWLASGTTIRGRFLQSASVDQDTGYLWVSYYDCRNDYTGTPVPGFDSTYNNETQYYVTVSLDGGMTYLPDIAISDGVSSEDRADSSFPGGGPDNNDYGDYSSIAAVGGSAYAAWADNNSASGNDFDIAVDRVWLSSSGGQNIFATGTASADTYNVRLDLTGKFLQIYENNPTMTGVPTFTATYAAVNKLFFTTGAGDDTVKFDFTNGNPIPVNGYSYNGEADLDKIIIAADRSYTLSDALLLVSGAGDGTLTSVERADLSGGSGVNAFIVDDWHGASTLAGGAGVDTYRLTMYSSMGPTDIVETGAPDADVTVLGSAAADTFTVVGSTVTRGSEVLNLAGVATLTIDGGGGADTFNITPSATTTISVVGNTPNDAFADFLVLDHTGATSPAMTATGDRQGNWTYGNRMPVNFNTIEKMTPGVSISGRAYSDLDRNRIDTGNAEPGLGGISISLYGDLGSIFATSTTTAAGTGVFTFTDLVPGYYRVRENLTSGYMQSSDDPAAFSYSSPFPIAGVEFGNIAATIVWTGQGFDGLWSNTANWLPTRLPNASDDVGIPKYMGATSPGNSGITAIKSLVSYSSIGAGYYNIAVAEDSLIDGDLTLWGGDFSGAGKLTIDGKLYWVAGALTGTGETEVFGGVEWATGTYGYGIDQSTLKLHGLSKYIAGFMDIVNNGQIIIAPDGVFEIDKPNNSYDIRPGAGSDNRIINYGILRNLNPNSGLPILVHFNNYGQVFAVAGTVYLDGGGINAGSYSGNPGSTIHLSSAFSGGPTHFVAGAACYGDFVLAINHGTLSVETPISVPNVYLGYGGVIDVPASLTTTQRFIMDSGTLTGAGTVYASGGMDVTSSSLINGPTMHVGGTSAWTAGYLYLAGNSQFYIDSGALINKTTSYGEFSISYGTGTERVVNNGTFRLNFPNNVFAFNARLENAGTLEALAGEIRIGGGGFNAGAFSGQADGKISVYSSFSFQAGASSSLSLGMFNVVTGVFSVDVNCTVGTMTLVNATLTGAGNLTVTGPLTCGNALQAGIGQTIAAGGVSWASPYGYNVIDGRKIIMQGNSQWTERGVYVNNGGQLVVDVGAIFVMSIYGGDMGGNLTPGVPNLLNRGTTRVSSANGNIGTLANFAIRNEGIFEVVESGAYLQMYGSNFSMVGGTLRGLGSILGTVTTASGSTIAPGASPGIFGIGGALTYDPTSSLAIELNGTTVGTGYDQLFLVGTVDLAGATLNVTRGFSPSLGTQFTILDNDGGDPIVGTFNGLSQGATFQIGGQSFTISYTGGTGNDIVLEAASAGDSVAPTVVGMYFGGTLDSDGAGTADTVWTSSFRSAAGNATYGFPAQTASNQLKSMPWSNIDTVYVQFSENVNVASINLGVRGLNLANYAIASFTYDNVNFVAKWVLTGAGPGGNIETDRMIFDLDGDSGTAIADLAGNKLAGGWTEGVSTFPTTGAAGQDFKYRFVVAVGDADRNGLVRNADVNLVRSNLFVDAGQAGYNIFADIDGNGLVRNADTNVTRSHLFVDPPAGPGPNRPGRGPGAGSSGRLGRGANGGQFVSGRGSGDTQSPSLARRSSISQATESLDALFAEL